MASRLTANVVLRDPNGAMTCLPAGSEPPAWAVGRVGGHVLSSETQAPPPAAPKPPVEVDVAVHDQDGTVHEATVETASSSEAPPQGGPGSGRVKWAEYARSHGVEFASDDSRDDIIGACERAGVRVD